MTKSKLQYDETLTGLIRYRTQKTQNMINNIRVNKNLSSLANITNVYGVNKCKVFSLEIEYRIMTKLLFSLKSPVFSFSLFV